MTAEKCCLVCGADQPKGGSFGDNTWKRWKRTGDPDRLSCGPLCSHVCSNEFGAASGDEQTAYLCGGDVMEGLAALRALPIEDERAYGIAWSESETHGYPKSPLDGPVAKHQLTLRPMEGRMQS